MEDLPSNIEIIGKEEADLFEYELNKYRRCIYEIKHRLLLLKERLELGSTQETKRVDFEIICLQFRGIFELIYLMSLAANQRAYDKGYNKLKSEWSIKRISEFLKKINPDFYPQPVEILDNDELRMGKFIHLAPSSSNYLTKEKLQEYHTICSDYIHPKNPFAEDNDYKVWSQFPIWHYEICILIQSHMAKLYKENRSFFCKCDLHAPIGEKDIFLFYMIQDNSETIS